MIQPRSAIRAMVLATGVALALTYPLSAAPRLAVDTPAARSDVVKVQDSAKIIRRDKPHDGAWNRPDHRGEVHREGRREARDGQGRDNIYRPRATPKYAYDAQGNFRVYDGNRPRRDGRWHDRNGRYDRRQWEYWTRADDWRGWEERGRWDDHGHWNDGHWDDHGRWDDGGHWDDGHWDDGHRRPHYKMNSFGYQQPSPALKQVLTAVPEGADAQ